MTTSGIYGHNRHMSTQPNWGAFPEFTAGDRIRLIRRKMLNMTQPEFSAALGVSKEALGAWESGRNEAGITAAVARRVEMLTGQPGIAAWLLDVYPTGPWPSKLNPAQDQEPPGLRFKRAKATRRHPIVSLKVA